jgi:hypothetical protein
VLDKLYTLCYTTQMNNIKKAIKRISDDAYDTLASDPAILLNMLNQRVMLSSNEKLDGLEDELDLFSEGPYLLQYYDNNICEITFVFKSDYLKFMTNR